MNNLKTIPTTIWILWGIGLLIANLDWITHLSIPYWLRLSGVLLAFTCMVLGKMKYDKRKREAKQ